jgi:hypothetical protein
MRGKVEIGQIRSWDRNKYSQFVVLSFYSTSLRDYAYVMFFKEPFIYSYTTRSIEKESRIIEGTQ